MHQTMIDMHLPAFKKGYQAGRKLYFENGTAPTDKDLLDSLTLLAEEGGFTNETERDNVAYSVGQLMGQTSGAVIPKQKDEDDSFTREYRLLQELAPDLDSDQARTLFDTVVDFWRAQDTLATLLDNTMYERVLSRDMPLVLRRGDK